MPVAPSTSTPAIVVVGAFGGYAPNWNFEAAPIHPDDPISVSWQDGDAIAELTDHVAGLGGSRVIPGPDGTLRPGGRHHRIAWVSATSHRGPGFSTSAPRGR